MSQLKKAQKIIGYGAISQIARELQLTPGAVAKWFRQGYLPQTEITEVSGKRKTSYGLHIERLTGGQVTDASLRNDIQALLNQNEAA